MTSIGKETFHRCRLLETIEIPNSVTYIGDGAFSFCESLTSITIPDSVTYVGNKAFYACETLKYIYCKAESKPDGWHDNWQGYSPAEVIWG